MTLEAILAGLGTVVTLIVAAFFGGKIKARREAEEDHAQREVNEYVETRKRMDQVEPAADADDARERLRARLDRKS